jgi:hypothetical protein
MQSLEMEAMIVNQASLTINRERFRRDLGENARTGLIVNVTDDRAFFSKESILSIALVRAYRPGATPGCARSSP